MTLNEMNEKLKTTKVEICPWDAAYSNQCLVRVNWVAGNRTVSYSWEGLNGDPVTKESQVSYSTWRQIEEALQ